MGYDIADFDPVSWIDLEHIVDKIDDFSRWVLLISQIFVQDSSLLDFVLYLADVGAPER